MIFGRAGVILFGWVFLGLIANSADPALVHRCLIDTLRFADRAAV